MNDFEKALEDFEDMNIGILTASDIYTEYGDTIRRALKIASEMRWRPIEEAPRDETEIMLGGRGYACMGRFEKNSWWVPDAELSEPWTELVDPTHWMPLPPAPEGE